MNKVQQYSFFEENEQATDLNEGVFCAPKIRGIRNQTLSLTAAESKKYLDMCIAGSDLQKAKKDILKNSVIYGDSFEVLKKLPDEFVDLLIVDPPYNLTKEYGLSYFEKISDAEYAEYTKKWIEAVIHCLKPNASIYVCCDWKSSLVVGSVLQEYFYIQNRITWQREKGRGAKSNWKNSMEDIWFATVSKNNFTFNVDDVKMRRKVIAPYKVDGKPKDWVESANGNYRDMCPSNFWDDISVPYWSMPENTAHPTQKPEKLIAKIILASSNEGDFVFDPFIGSGTSAVVASKLGRAYSGIECEKEYCAVAQKRLELSKNCKGIQGYCDGVFWERNSLAEQNKFKKNKDKKT